MNKTLVTEQQGSFFDLFQGKQFPFYGVDGHCFKIGDLVFEAVEDPDDGYRSYLSTIELRENHNCIFPSEAFCTVTIQDNHLDGFSLIDLLTKQPILEVGTDDLDDYYPCFVFNYNGPKIYGQFLGHKLYILTSLIKD